MAINGPFRLPEAKYCKYCDEHIVLGSTHLNGGKLHWQEIVLAGPGLIGLAMLAMIGLVILGALMHATGMGSGYN